MPPTSTILFPEILHPVIDGYNREKIDGLASTPTDTGAEQVRKRHGELSVFRYRTKLGLTEDQIKTIRTFTDLCGNGDVNFTFYEPQSFRYEELFVGLSAFVAGVQIIPWRGLGSFNEFEIGGSSLFSDLVVDGEFVTPTKEDRLTLLSATPLDGLPMVFFNAYARRRYICRMLSWSMSPAFGGAATIISEGDPTFPSPVYPQRYEFHFKEKG